jgi:AcrR family transcriptional regulator
MATQAERTDATTGRLLDAGRRLFGERGYAQTSTEEVVAAANVTRGALYHHFRNKEGLFAAVFERESERLAAAVLEAASGYEDAGDRIRAGCRVFLEKCLSPDYQRIALVDGPAVLGHQRARGIEAAHTFRLLASGLRDASRGRSSRAEVEVRTTLLFGALCEAGMLLARSPAPREAMAGVAAAVGSMVDALLEAPDDLRSGTA